MFDPTKRDYPIQDGAPTPTDRIEEQTYFVLTIPLSKWLYGVQGEGSDLWKFRNARRLSTTEQTFAARTIDALNRQLVATGKAKQVAVSNIATSRYGTSNEIEVEAAQQSVATKIQFNPL